METLVTMQRNILPLFFLFFLGSSAPDSTTLIVGLVTLPVLFAAIFWFLGRIQKSIAHWYTNQFEVAQGPLTIIARQRLSADLQIIVLRYKEKEMILACQTNQPPVLLSTVA